MGQENLLSSSQKKEFNQLEIVPQLYEDSEQTSDGNVDSDKQNDISENICSETDIPKSEMSEDDTDQ